MRLARVTGTVVSTRKEPSIRSLKLLLVQPTKPDGEASGEPLVAVDAVGAGVHEIVLIAQGSSARMTELSNERPVDAVIMAIVDVVEIGGEVVYRKSGLDR
jgi:microcompartment protein CcmK/EutM